MDNQNKTKQNKQNKETINTEYESPLSFYVILSLIAVLITLVQVSSASLASLPFLSSTEKTSSKTQTKPTKEKPLVNNSNNSNLSRNSDDQNFQKAMIPILKFEGKCSDDRYDSGGRTYMGITTRVARRNEYRGDVCNMPESQVYAIYKKDYWDILPVNLAYPEKLALFNITINGSSRRCKNKSTAEAMLTCQQKYYESLRVFWRFGKGWTARNNYFISLIQQLRREGH
jgi:hypothetical protein